MSDHLSAKQTSLLKKGLVPVIAILGLVLVVAWMAGSFRDQIEPGLEPNPAHELTNALPVDIERIETFEPVPASIAARQTTIISSRVLARITDILVNAGDQVSQGDLLVMLENEDFQAEVQQARARVNALEARLIEAQTDLERSLQLRQTGVLSQSDLDRARANHDSLVAELDAARQALEQSETILGYTRIQSPIDGLVVDRFSEPGDTASTGVQILTLYNPTTLRVEAHVRESLSLALAQGQSLQVQIPSLEQTLNATIEERVPAADPGSRSFLVKARLEQTPGLQPGMYARIMIPSHIEEQLLVPKDRIGRVGQMQIAWVATPAGQIERRFVRTGTDYPDGRIQVTSGLTAEDRILPIPEQMNEPR